MKTNPFFKRIALILLFCCCSLATNAFAQVGLCDSCPAAPTDDAQHTVATPPWNSGNISITYNGCNVTICYGCRQTSLTNFDYTITQICIDSACFASMGTTWDALRNALLREVLLNNPCNFPCPSCPNSDISWSESQMTCWKTIAIYDIFTHRTRYITFACPAHGWCLNAYKVCCDADGTRHFTYYRSVSTGGCDANDPYCVPQSCPTHF